MKRIHIVGCSPRSGTTLLTETMISCFEIELYEKHEASIFQQPPREENIFLTKRPADICIAKLALMINPDLYVIYLLRDPRDIICSKHAKDPDRYWAGLSFWNTYSSYGHRLQKHERFIEIRYEELVSDPDKVQAELMERMRFLVKKTPFSNYHKLASPSAESIAALGGVRPISTARIGNWRNHHPRVVGQMRLHNAKSLAKDLIEYGYEKNGAWLKELEGICPDTTPSHLPDIFNRKMIKVIRGHYVKGLATMLLRRVCFALHIPRKTAEY